MDYRSEFAEVVDTIYDEMANLQSDTNVLIIADSRTPRDVVSAFMGGAMTYDATVSTIENETPPPPSLQPSTEWNSMVQTAAKEADLIVDLAVGYADFIVDAVLDGTRVIMPGDGTGAEHIQESLIRTVLAADIHELRREADQIADLLTEGDEVVITSEEGTDLTIDISGLKGDPSDGFLWDPDEETWKSSWAIVPPAQPGMTLPKGKGNGVIAVDGYLLYEPAYDHETPTEPVYIHIDDGKITKVEGDPLFAGRLREWLNSLDGESGAFGPVHFNVGTNPRAMLTQHLEFERIRGTIDFGFGDSSSLARLLDYNFEPIESDVHWDVLIMRPTMKVDDTEVISNGFISNEFNVK